MNERSGPLRTWLRQNRLAVRLVLFVALALAILLPAIEWRELQVERELAELRETQPQAYLDRLRQQEGFSSYLPAYAELNGYRDWHARPPGFLEGGWRLYEVKQEVSTDFRPDVCHPAIYVEPGELHLRGPGDRYPDARYRIRDGRIEVQLLDAGRFTITPVAPGEHIYYLKIDGLPGTDGPRYAYRCG